MAKNLAPPAISVIMSVYNGQAYVAAAIDSILAQTFRDFEFIVIDDGSSDSTPSILAGYHDRRLRVITQENQGLVASLRYGISQAKAPLIARQDADDLSKPDRLEKEYDLLRKLPGVVLVGSSISTLDRHGKFRHNHYVLLGNAELKQELLVRSPFAHGSVMFRKQAYLESGGYDQTEWPAEDYGLWLRLAPHGDFSNLDQPLYMYRENDAGISLKNAGAQEQRVAGLQRAAWKSRRQLLGRPVNTVAYQGLPMEQFRLERLAGNLLFALRKSLLRGDVLTAVTDLRLIVGDKKIFRKCVRLVLIKLGFKRG